VRRNSTLRGKTTREGGLDEVWHAPKLKRKCQYKGWLQAKKKGDTKKLEGTPNKYGHKPKHKKKKRHPRGRKSRCEGEKDWETLGLKRVLKKKRGREDLNPYSPTAWGCS